MDAITPNADLNKPTWNAEREALLRQFYARNLSCARTAIEINLATGSDFTRNAIIGKAGRLGLENNNPSRGGRTAVDIRERLKEKMSSRPIPSTRAARLARQKELAAIRAEAPEGGPAPIVLNPADRVQFLQLENHHCRFPLWSDNTPTTERFYCGTPTASLIQRRPYCAGHSALAGRMYSPRNTEAA